MAARCAEQFGVPLVIVNSWETTYVRVLADALRYPLESDPKGLKSNLVDMYHIAVRKTVAQLRAEGLSPMQTDMGDLLLAREARTTASSPEDIAFLTNMGKKRRDGVRDADFRTWWNRHLFASAIQMTLNQAELDLTLMHLSGSGGLTPEQAKVQVLKTFPAYGDPEDTCWATGEDRRLYIELFHRVSGYLRRRTQDDPDALQSDLQHFTSVNALVRAEMRTGRLHE
jgi:hypothetical protein